LLGNYPNPFNPSTNLRFTTPQAGNLTFEVFNVLGQKVTSFTFMATRSGLHEAAFDAKNLASGSYVIRMSAAGFTRSMNVLLAK